MQFEMNLEYNSTPLFQTRVFRRGPPKAFEERENIANLNLETGERKQNNFGARERKQF